MPTTILAVDDSRSVRKMVQFALETKGYEVMTAGDGEEALETLGRGQFDLVVLDINMPRLDGFSFLEEVRGRPAWTKLPILVLTTEGQEADRDRALGLGATDYMVKPFKPTQLLERVAELLGAESVKRKA